MPCAPLPTSDATDASRHPRALVAPLCRRRARVPCAGGRSTDGGLHYAGRVESGLPRRDDSLLKALRLLPAPTITVAAAPASRSIVWTEPRLSADVRALAWQPGRSLRVAVLRAIVIDKTHLPDVVKTP